MRNLELQKIMIECMDLHIQRNVDCIIEIPQHKPEKEETILNVQKWAKGSE
jgi:hypothetical protein